MVQDIDERKKAEEERNRLQQQLFQAQKMEALGTLAGGIAHDFNNLLSVMLGFASLARQRLSSDDPLQDSMGMIEQSAQRAAELTRQLLGFARPERQQVKPVCVDDVLDRVRRMVERTFDRNITVAVHKGSEPLWVNAEPSYLEQALLNMCINARDAMPQGGTLTLEAAAIHPRAASAGTSCDLPSGALCPNFRPGYGGGNRTRNPAQGLRAVLHHQRAGPRHGAGSRHGLRVRQKPRRVRESGKRARPRRAVHHLPSPDSRPVPAGGRRQGWDKYSPGGEPCWWWTMSRWSALSPRKD